ncbi:LOW QUALITY PROTEIN: hypothetical protein J0S82_001993 [Galemys pyrenaicus]|uniref:Uncharacterized protein n=1 Tax=Galemys pyrenaicus TaxID=202257 RepID=A0A8J6ASD8_GALPY|nr:LOW QUALITY PROTEIN: hypothetical protein J0S82_001993 [Galemys pyrenaicus]
MTKLRVVGGNPDILITGCSEDARASLDIQHHNKKTKHRLSSGFQNFVVHNVKELEVLLTAGFTVLKLLTFLLELQSHCGRSSLAGH